MTCILRPQPRWGIMARGPRQSSGSANSEGKLKHLDNLATPGNHKYQRTRTEYRNFLYNSSIESDFGGNTQKVLLFTNVPYKFVK